MNKNNDFKRAPKPGGKPAGLLKFIRISAMVLGAAGCILILRAYLEKVSYPFETILNSFTSLNV